MVKQCTIIIWSTSWNRVWVLVNTLKHGTIVNVTWISFVVWHEVARVLQSPCWWTPSFSWDHCDCHPCWSIADSTGNIVFLNSWEWSSWLWLILSSIHRAPPLHPRLVCKVVWIIGHAEVVSTSSSVAPPASSSPSCIHELCSSDIWAAGFSPPYVDYPSIPWARWTCYSLISPLSSRSMRTRHTISPILPSLPRSTSMYGRELVLTPFLVGALLCGLCWASAEEEQWRFCIQKNWQSSLSLYFWTPINFVTENWDLKMRLFKAKCCNFSQKCHKFNNKIFCMSSNYWFGCEVYWNICNF